MGNVSLLEALWILVNTVTLAYVVTALSDARADQAAVKLLNGKAREVAAQATIRREWLRIVKVLLLMAVAVPGLFFADGEARPDALRVLPVLALMTLALLLLYQSYTDARDRKRLIVLVTAEALATKTDALSRIEEGLAENTRISQEASDHADAAYREANNVNAKIASQGAAIIKQGEARLEAAPETEGGRKG